MVAVLATRSPASVTGKVVSDLGGKTAPNIKGADIASDKQISLDSMLQSHKYVLIDFFASWCTTCQQDMAQLEAFQFHNSKKVSILGVDIDDSAANGIAFLRSYGAKWPAIEDSNGPDSIAVTYGVASPPEMFLIAPDRKVVAYFVGGATENQLNAALDDLQKANLKN